MRAAALTAALLASTAAHAAGPVRLEHVRERGAESCPDREAFEAMVAARVGAVSWSDSASRLVRVVFFTTDGRVSGRMELLEGAAVLGVRDAHSASARCRDVAESLGLAVALAIDPPRVKPRHVSDAADSADTADGADTGRLLDAIGPADSPAVRDAVAFEEVTAREAVVPEPPATDADRIAPPEPRRHGRPIPVMLFAGTEGGYSYWSGGSQGADDRFMTIAWSGDFAAGGEAPLTNGYMLDVLVSGYGAVRHDRRDVTDFEQAGRQGLQDDHLYVKQSVGATAMRASVRYESEQTAVSLGMLVGGFRRHGCQHERTVDWQSALCRDLQQWAAFPTFGARLGPVTGPYVTIGFLDRRSVSGEIAHLGVGAILPGDWRADTSLVAAAEGVGARLQLEMPLGDRFVLMPAVSGGILYDTFSGGGRNSWIRTGIAVGVRR